MTARLEHRIDRVQIPPHFSDMGPFNTLTPCQIEGVVGDGFKSLDVAALGINFEQLGMDGHTPRVDANGFLEDFFGLQVAAISQVHVGLSHRVHIAGRVKLAWRVDHG